MLEWNYDPQKLLSKHEEATKDKNRNKKDK